MKLGATITSERGKAITKTGNEFITISININQNIVYNIVLDSHGFLYIGSIQQPRYRVLTVNKTGIIEDITNINSLKHDKKCICIDGILDRHCTAKVHNW